MQSKPVTGYHTSFHEEINTTLYELLLAIQEEMDSGEEHLATQVVANLLRENRIHLA